MKPPIVAKSRGKRVTDLPVRRPVFPIGPGSQGIVPTIAVLLLAVACRSSSSAGDLPVPRPQAEEIALGAMEGTQPQEPTRIRFDFRVKEADLRFNGEGLARVEPPYRVRLDLFSGGGETIFQAALVEGTLRIPPWAPRELAPPPALLWAALGIFRPDPDLSFLGGRTGKGGDVTLSYGGEDDLELRFRIEGGQLVRAELHREGHLLEEVDLSHDESTGAVRETVYRNRALFLELSFFLQSVDNVESFPAAIWYPGG